EGVLEGLVTNAADGQALADATVLVIGTSITTQTGAQGRYRLTGFAGPVELQAIRVGFNAAEVRLTVADSGVVVVNFQLRPAPVLLDQVVVTASGQASRQRPNGASGAEIVPDSFLPAAIQTFSDLI